MLFVALAKSGVVAPMFAASDVIPFLCARRLRKARLRNFFRRFILERFDFCRVSFLNVTFSWPMTCLTSSYFVFPTIDFGETGVGSMGERLQLVFGADLAGRCRQNYEFDQLQCLHPEPDHVAGWGWKKLSILTVTPAFAAS